MVRIKAAQNAATSCLPYVAAALFRNCHFSFNFHSVKLSFEVYLCEALAVHGDGLTILRINLHTTSKKVEHGRGDSKSQFCDGGSAKRAQRLPIASQVGAESFSPDKNQKADLGPLKEHERLRSMTAIGRRPTTPAVGSCRFHREYI